MKRGKRQMIAPLLAWVVVLAVSLAGCSKETIPGDDRTPVGAGEPVQVTLRLGAMAAEQVATGGKPAHAAQASASARVVASQRTRGALVELVETPDEPATRAVDDQQIHNVWVFQFDGTDPTAKLIKKEYYEYTPGMTLELLKGTDQRIVVLANTMSGSLGLRYIIGTSTYQMLLDDAQMVYKSDHLLTNNYTNLPMSGEATAMITGQMMEVNIPLRRNVAEVSVEVRNGVMLMTGDWTAQLCNVAGKSYYLPHRTDAVFPADGLTTVDYPAEIMPALNTQAFEPTGTWYVPCNRRGTVPGTLATERKTKAPAGATYLKITGASDDGVSIPRTYTYTIPLGGNVTDDYNLLPNYRYTYRVTLYDNTDDSQVEMEESWFYVGMFGGELAEVAPGVWQFTKKLYIQKTDESADCYWATWTSDHSALAGKGVANYTRDGRQITWNLGSGNAFAPTNFPAANACYKKVGNPATINSKDDLVWYLPAQDQLMAAWGAHGSFSTAFGSYGYWSATENGSSYSWYVYFDGGAMGAGTKTSNNRVRCVREL